jgi:hypothetical protein
MWEVPTSRLRWGYQFFIIFYRQIPNGTFWNPTSSPSLLYISKYKVILSYNLTLWTKRLAQNPKNIYEPINWIQKPPRRVKCLGKWCYKRWTLNNITTVGILQLYPTQTTTENLSTVGYLNTGQGNSWSAHYPSIVTCNLEQYVVTTSLTLRFLDKYTTGTLYWETLNYILKSASTEINPLNIHYLNTGNGKWWKVCYRLLQLRFCEKYTTWILQLRNAEDYITFWLTEILEHTLPEHWNRECLNGARHYNCHTDSNLCFHTRDVPFLNLWGHTCLWLWKVITTCK